MTTNRWTQSCWLLGLVLVPVGCAGDKFSDCTSGACPSDAAGGEAGAGTDTTGVTSGDAGDAGDAASSTSSSSAGGSRDASGSGGSGGSGGSDGSGGSSSEATTRGEAGGGSFGEGGAGASSACESSCAGTCCDEVCVDLEADPNHCGVCGTVCELANAQATCIAGSCAVSNCEDEHVDCNGEADDGCEVDLVGFPEAPQLRRPMFGAFTGSLHARETIGSLRPEFAWAEVEPVTCSTITYQLQVEDDCPFTGFAGCDFASPELDVAGLVAPEFVPESDLPVEEEQPPVGRRYYWRARACEAADVCSEWSEVFYVDVGRVREDMTGDGYADVVGVTNTDNPQPELFIIRGGGDFGESNTADTMLGGTPPNTNAATLGFLGDVNGDGFNDVGAVCGPWDSDFAELLVWTGGTVFGPPTGVAGPANRSYDVPGVWAGGDFDRDGYADMVLARVLPDDDLGQFLKPGEAILNEHPEAWVPIGPKDDSASEWGGPTLHAATSGDFNADGYPDLAVDAEVSQTSVRFVFGQRAPEPAQERTIELFSGKATHRDPVMATLDFNGDDIDDLAVLNRLEASLVVVLGSSDLHTEAVPQIWSVELEVEPSDLAVGDLDETGFDDLMVSGPVVFEGAADPDTSPLELSATAAPEEPIAIADHNGDGLLDVVLANAWYEGTGGGAKLPVDLDVLDVIALAH